MKCIKRAAAERVFWGATRRASISQSVRTPSHFLILCEALSLIWARAACTCCCTRGCFDDNNTSSSFSLPAARSLRRAFIHRAPYKSTLPSVCVRLNFQNMHSVHNTRCFGTTVNGPTFSNSTDGKGIPAKSRSQSSRWNSPLSVLFFTFNVNFETHQQKSGAKPGVLYQSAAPLNRSLYFIIWVAKMIITMHAKAAFPAYFWCCWTDWSSGTRLFCLRAALINNFIKSPMDSQNWHICCAL